MKNLLYNRLAFEIVNMNLPKANEIYVDLVIKGLFTYDSLDNFIELLNVHTKIVNINNLEIDFNNKDMVKLIKRIDLDSNGYFLNKAKTYNIRSFLNHPLLIDYYIDKNPFHSWYMKDITRNDNLCVNYNVVKKMLSSLSEEDLLKNLIDIRVQSRKKMKSKNEIEKTLELIDSYLSVERLFLLQYKLKDDFFVKNVLKKITKQDFCKKINENNYLLPLFINSNIDGIMKLFSTFEDRKILYNNLLKIENLYKTKFKFKDLKIEKALMNILELEINYNDILLNYPNISQLKINKSENENSYTAILSKIKLEQKLNIKIESSKKIKL